MEPLTITVTIEMHVRRHVCHIAEIAGWADVGIGSHLDGGFGREETPEEIDTIADLQTLGSAVPAQFHDALLGESWLASEIRVAQLTRPFQPTVEDRP